MSAFLRALKGQFTRSGRWKLSQPYAQYCFV
jgi:hypothetical protein